MTLLRKPQSARVRARVDVSFRLITAPDGELVTIPDVPCTAFDWLRNRPGEADTATIRLAGDALPFDLRVIADKSMFVHAWLYDERQREPPKHGGPGHFAGVVDDVQRHRYTLETTLSCRDLTAVPLQAFMPEDLVKSFEILPGQSLYAVVEDLVRQIPGTHDWRVQALTTAAFDDALPIVRPAKRGTGRAAKVKPGRLSDLVPAERVSVWSAISSVCARAGLVCEVMVDRRGDPKVVIADGKDLHRSDVLRPFKRGTRDWRVFVDSDGIADFMERLDLSGGDARPDYVEVGTRATDGRLVSVRWPPAPADKEAQKSERGSFQFVDGVTEAELAPLARAGFEGLAGNQYRAEITAAEPWSAGGGPEDPDLFDLGFGAICEVVMPAFDEATAGRAATQVLSARGVRADLAQKLIAASSRLGQMSLMFQVSDVRHAWGSASPYRCTIAVRQFLGTRSLPVLQRAEPEGHGGLGVGAGVAL